MKTLRLLATVLLVALCTGFYSCSGDDEEEPLDVSMDKTYPTFEDYCKYPNIMCNYLRFSEEEAILSGIKDKHLWFSTYNKESKTQILEWEDIEKIDKVFKYYVGYGKYEEFTIEKVYLSRYKKTTNGSITLFNFLDISASKVLGRAIFVCNDNAKRITLSVDYSSGRLSIPPLIDWYKESVFIGDCCYSCEGDTIYIAKNYPYFSYQNLTLPVSYEEGIVASTSSIERYNYKLGYYKWRRDIKPSFEVPSNAKSTISILDSSTNIWKYRVDYTFYDGTKKDYTFSINIDNGELNSDTISLVGKWKIDSSDTNGKVEKWDGYPYYIITDTHFYFTDAAGATKSDYCTYTFDKANKILKGKYVNGGNSYEMIVTKQTATQADFKWDEEGDGRKMVTIHCTKVP